MPIVTFSIWCLVKDVLLTDKVKVKEQLVEAEQSLEKIQEEEVRKSVSVTDTQSEDEEESQHKTKAKKVKVKESSSSSSSKSDSEEEERSITPAAKQALRIVESSMENMQVNQINYDKIVIFGIDF
ncbi:hypothetical protein STEG23_025137 [Scotinomys teguina]